MTFQEVSHKVKFAKAVILGGLLGSFCSSVFAAGLDAGVDLEQFYKSGYTKRLPVENPHLIYLDRLVCRSSFTEQQCSSEEFANWLRDSLAARIVAGGQQAAQPFDRQIPPNAEEAVELGAAQAAAAQQGGQPSFSWLTPYASQYKDEWGKSSAGDGRAMTFAQIGTSVVNVKGIGVTPYAPSRRELVRNFNLRAVRGQAKFREALDGISANETLSAAAIPGERVLAVISLADNFQNANFENLPGSLQEFNAAYQNVDSELPVLIVRVVPGGSFRMGHLEIWDGEQTRRALNYLKRTYELEHGKKAGSTSDEAYLAFDAVMTGKIAARMVYHQVSHGALSLSNVPLYPGVIDLDSLRKLTVPDYSFFTLAWYSRFGKTKSRLKSYLVQRQRHFAKLNRYLVQVPVESLFVASFREELAKQLLVRLGYVPGSQELEQEASKPKVQEWAYSYQSLASKHLNTNLSCLMDAAIDHWDEAAAAPIEWLGQELASNRCTVGVIPASRFAFLQSSELFLRRHVAKLQFKVALPWFQQMVQLRKKMPVGDLD